MSFYFFFFNDTATTEIYTYRHTLSLHDALPILFQCSKTAVGAYRHAFTGVEGHPAGIAPLSIRSDHHLPLQQSDRIDTAGNVDLEAGARGGDRTAGRVDDARTDGVVLYLEIDTPSPQGKAEPTAATKSAAQ